MICANYFRIDLPNSHRVIIEPLWCLKIKFRIRFGGFWSVKIMRAFLWALTKLKIGNGRKRMFQLFSAYLIETHFCRNWWILNTVKEFVFFYPFMSETFVAKKKKIVRIYCDRNHLRGINCSFNKNSPAILFRVAWYFSFFFCLRQALIYYILFCFFLSKPEIRLEISIVL